MLWGDDEQIQYAIQAYQQAKQLGAVPADVDFRLGVAFRQRYDSPQQQPGDFQAAVKHWTVALDAQPGQYIWRRRIQQYGPRLNKPYPFYDWVAAAEKEIEDRGETPVKLPVRLTAAEVALPSKSLDDSAADKSEKNPDPENLLTLDKEQDVEIVTTVVPAHVKAGETVRVHAVFDLSQDTKWNNEGRPLLTWINKSDGIGLASQLLSYEQPTEPESNETRRIEFEVSIPKGFAGTSLTLDGFAVYTICSTTTGQCNMVRQDFAIEIPVSAK